MVTLWLLLIFNINSGYGNPQTPLTVYDSESACLASATYQQAQGNPAITWAGCAELAVQGVDANPAPTPTPSATSTPTASPT